MNNLFSNAASDLAGSEKEKDVLGGRRFLETDAYDARIDVAYVTKSSGGASAFNFVVDVNGQKIREQIYVTNKQGGVTYTKDSKKYPLPGYSLVNAIAKLAVGKEIPALVLEPKLVKIYNFEQKKEIATEVPVAVELTGAQINLGIARVLENKQVKDQAGNYVSVADTRESNQIERVFHPTSGQTVNEFDTQAPAEFKALWLKEFKGKLRDRTDKNLKPSTPAAAGSTSSTPAAGGSLFGNKG